MDAEWLNRTGILAEAISFVLIAPEIIGPERLKRFEKNFEEWGRRNLNASYVVWSRSPGFIVPIVPAIRDDPRGNVLFEVSYLVGSIFLWVLIPRLLGGVFDMFLLQMIMLGTTLGGGLGILAIYLGRSWRLVRYVGYALGVFAVPSLLTLAAATAAVFFSLRMVVRLLMRLLTGEARLRPLVFSTGLMLLFGGMAAQFTSTF